MKRKKIGKPRPLKPSSRGSPYVFSDADERDDLFGSSSDIAHTPTRNTPEKQKWQSTSFIKYSMTVKDNIISKHFERKINKRLVNEDC